MKRKHHADRRAGLFVVAFDDLCPCIGSEAHGVLKPGDPHFPKGLIGAAVMLKDWAVFKLWRNERPGNLVVVPHNQIERVLQSIIRVQPDGSI